MPETSARLLRLLALLQSRNDWTGPELADRLGVTDRTIRNDVARLRSLGYPVDGTAGSVGGYRLRAGTDVPPLLLDDEEAVAVAVGLRTAACTSLAGIEEISLRALTKLEQILPARLQRRVQALATEVAPLRWGTPVAIVDPEALALLSLASRDREQVRFDYEDKEGAATRRMVEPYGLVSDGSRWYLYCFDVGRDDWRTFRVDRMSAAQHTGVRFRSRPLPAPDAATAVRDAIRSVRPSHTAVVVLHAPAHELEGRMHPGTDHLDAIDAGRCRLTTVSESLEWLAMRLALLGCEFEVEQPDALVDALRAAAARLHRATA